MFNRVFFFFKQKTAYELRISDWSSDVCSSDLFIQRFGIKQIQICKPNLRPGINFGRIRDSQRHRVIIIHQRSEEHTSELQSLMRNSYAVFCLKKKKKHYALYSLTATNTIRKVNYYHSTTTIPFVSNSQI